MDGGRNKGNSKPAQVTVVLRLIAGGYLIYLSLGLMKEYLKPDTGGVIYQMGFALLFFAVGVFLAGWSIARFIKGEYVKYGESPEDGGEAEADEPLDSDLK